MVRGGVALARRLRVPPVVVALSIVALGTSLPELMVSIRASMEGYPNLILGNVVGSNIANVMLVGGAAAAIYPLRMKGKAVRRPGVFMLGVSVLFAVLCFTGGLTRLEGGILLGVLVVAFSLTARDSIKAHREEDHTPLEWVLGVPSTLPIIGLFIVIGIVSLPLGADLLVDSAVQLAERFGVSETVIGLSIVAIGTSLPEVATTVLAAMRKRSAMAVGTIIGSNTFNILGIMGITALMSDSIPVSTRFLMLDLPLMLGMAALLMGFAFFGRAVGRLGGGLLLSGYTFYLVTLYFVA